MTPRLQAYQENHQQSLNWKHYNRRRRAIIAVIFGVVVLIIMLICHRPVEAKLPMLQAHTERQVSMEELVLRELSTITTGAKP